MKKSELRKLVAEYIEVKIKLEKSQNTKLCEKLKEIKHRYYHETGENLEFKFKE